MREPAKRAECVGEGRDGRGRGEVKCSLWIIKMGIYGNIIMVVTFSRTLSLLYYSAVSLTLATSALSMSTPFTLAAWNVFANSTVKSPELQPMSNTFIKLWIVGGGRERERKERMVSLLQRNRILKKRRQNESGWITARAVEMNRDAGCVKQRDKDEKERKEKRKWKIKRQ